MQYTQCLAIIGRNLEINHQNAQIPNIGIKESELRNNNTKCTPDPTSKQYETNSENIEK